MKGDIMKDAKFSLGEVVRVIDLDLHGVVDIIAIDRSLPGIYRYIVEYINKEGTVCNGWWSQDRLESLMAKE